MAFSTTTTYQQSSSSAETYHWSSQMRHVPQEQQLEQLKQHERQSGLWAESCSIAPAFIVAHQTTSSLSQCTQYSHNIRTEQVATESSVSASDVYLDNLQLATEPLDLALQLSKSFIGRKVSLAGRRPPTSRIRPSSQGSILESHLTTDQAQLITGAKKTPPPRPPPPVFRAPLSSSSVPVASPPTVSEVNDDDDDDDFPNLSTETNGKAVCSFTSVSSLSSPSPPPALPAPFSQDILQSSTPIPGAAAATTTTTEVLHVHDQESMEDGQVVRRRTIITLGEKKSSPDASSSTVVVSSTTSSSSTSGNINVTVKTVRDSTATTTTAAAAANVPDSRSSVVASTDSTMQCSRLRNGAPQSSSYLRAPSITNSTCSESSDISAARTVSISMSFDGSSCDIQSSTSCTSRSNNSGGTAGSSSSSRVRRSEAWYERRQSYGFEAADKLRAARPDSNALIEQRVSRSCDSLVVSARSFAVDKMIPPWIRALSPKRADHRPDSRSSRTDSPSSSSVQSAGRAAGSAGGQYSRQASPAPLRPKCPDGGSGGGGGGGPLSDPGAEITKEPDWLRDLKVRRSLRDSSRPASQVETAAAAAAAAPPTATEPAWLSVKLRPTGLKLVDEPQRKHCEAQVQVICNNELTHSPIFHKLSSACQSASAAAADRSRSPGPSATSPQTKTFKIASPAASVAAAATRSACETSDPSAGCANPLIAGGIRCEIVHRPKVVRPSTLLNVKPIELSPVQQPAQPQFDETRSNASVSGGSVRDAGEQHLKASSGGGDDLAKRAKKVVFDKGVKEESDRASKPRRIRTRSPERWRESAVVRAAEVSLETCGLPVTRFGDLEPEMAASVSATASVASAAASAPNRSEAISDPQTSHTFRSLLQARKAATVHQVTESAVTIVDNGASQRPAQLGPGDPRPANIVNGIVNFDSSVDRKIVILETESATHKPKSILKKRSLENLATSQQQRPLQVPAAKSGGQQQPSEPPGAQEVSPPAEPVLPWRIHLKHVEPQKGGCRKSSCASEAPWTSEFMRKKCAAAAIRSRSCTPDNLLDDDRIDENRNPDDDRENQDGGGGGNSNPPDHDDDGRQENDGPVVMVARCHVKQTKFSYQAGGGDVFGTQSIEPTAVRKCSEPFLVLRPIKISELLKVVEPVAIESLVMPEARTDKRITLQVNDQHIHMLNDASQKSRQPSKNGHEECEPPARSEAEKCQGPHKSEPPHKYEQPAGELGNCAQVPKYEPARIEPERSQELKIASQKSQQSSIALEKTEASVVEHQAASQAKRSVSPINDAPKGEPQKSAPTTKESRKCPPAPLSENQQVQRLEHQKMGSLKLEPLKLVPMKVEPLKVLPLKLEAAQSTHQAKVCQHKESLPSAKPTQFEAMVRPETLYRLEILEPNLKTFKFNVDPVKCDLGYHSLETEFASQTGADLMEQSGCQKQDPTEITQSFDALCQQSFRSRFFSSTSHCNGSSYGPAARDATCLVGPAENSALENGVGNCPQPVAAVDQHSSDSTITQRNSEEVKVGELVVKLENRTKVKVDTAKWESSPLQIRFQAGGRDNKICSGGVTNKATDQDQKTKQLTSGMSEEKAALLVRKFFGHSIMETHKSRMAKTDVILEENSSSEPDSPHLLNPVQKSETTTTTPATPAAVLDDILTVSDVSYDSDDLFPASDTKVSSDFGSHLDFLEQATTDDDEQSSVATTKTLTSRRYSSCSERTWKMSSDSIDMMAMVPTTRSNSTSGIVAAANVRLVVGNKKHPPYKSSSGASITSTMSKTGQELKAKLPSLPVERPTHSSVLKAVRPPPLGSIQRTSPLRPEAKLPTRNVVREDRQVDNKKSPLSVKAISEASTTKPIKTSSTNRSSIISRLVKPVIRSTKNTTQVAPPTSKTPARTRLHESGAQKSTKTVSSKSQHERSAVTLKTPRLVTITPYSSKGSANRSSEGIQVTPVAVAAGHYKIRMDQRLQSGTKTTGSRH